MTAAKDGGRIPPSAGKTGSGTRAVNAVKRPRPPSKDAATDDVTTNDDAKPAPKEKEPKEEDPKGKGKGKEAAVDQTDADMDDEAPEEPFPSRSPGGTTDRHPLGVRRLDDLLDGGLERGTFTLLYGPPFLGKEHLSRLCVLEAVRAGIPAVLIHTDATADDMHAHFTALDADVVEQAVKRGLLQYIDCYSRPIEANESRAPNVRYVDGPMDLNGISLALNEAQRRLQADHDHHVVILDNLSTIIAYANTQTTFRFLQVLLGKGRRVGATNLVLLDQGMHSEPEVQTFRHLMTGSIDVRDHNGKYQLKVLGISNQEGLGWIDYRYHKDRFQVTGSFAPGRIR